MNSNHPTPRLHTLEPADHRVSLVALACLLLVMVSFIFAPAGWGQPPRPSEEQRQGSLVRDGLQSGMLVLSIPYTLTKMGVVTLGGILSGLDYVFSFGDTQGAATIWRVCAGGDYMLSLDHLTGRRSLHLVGTAEEPAEATPPNRLEGPLNPLPATEESVG